jgi:Tol biopolymer transport system component
VSPKGDKILFHSTLPLNGVDGFPLHAENVWLMNADGTGLTAVTKNTGRGHKSFAPRFSPDGSKISFFSNTDLTGKWDGTLTVSNNLWVVDLELKNYQPITQNSLAGLDANTNIIYSWAPKIDCKNSK